MQIKAVFVDKPLAKNRNFLPKRSIILDMTKRFWIITGISALIVSLTVFLFCIWQPVLENKNLSVELKKDAFAPRTTYEPAGNSQSSFGVPKETAIKPFFEQEKEKLNIPTLPIPKPDTSILYGGKSLPTSAPSFFKNIRNAVEIVETKIAQREIAAPAQPIPGALSTASVPGTTSTGILLSLTKEEFNYFYPDIFIANLMSGQSLLKEYDPTYEPLPKIETDSQVRFVEEKIVAAFFSANMITKDEAERYITTIRFTLPQLQLIELKNQKLSCFDKFTPFSEFLSPIFRETEQSSQSRKGLFLAGLAEKLFSAFIPEVQAKVCGYCYILPVCFQVGADSPTPGLNIVRGACYCTGCLYGQGCLDFCTDVSAIWDPITGICGCG